MEKNGARTNHWWLIYSHITALLLIKSLEFFAANLKKLLSSLGIAQSFHENCHAPGSSVAAEIHSFSWFNHGFFDRFNSSTSQKTLQTIIFFIKIHDFWWIVLHESCKNHPKILGETVETLGFSMFLSGELHHFWVTQKGSAPRTRQLRRDLPGLTARAAVPPGRTSVTHGSEMAFASNVRKKKYQRYRDLRDLLRDLSDSSENFRFCW